MTPTPTPTVTGAAALPRVNLLPPEIHQQAYARRITAGLAALVVVAVITTGLLYLQARHEVRSAQNDLDKQAAQQQELISEKGKLDVVGQVRAQVDATEATLTYAMGSQLSWSVILTNLAKVTPKQITYSSIDASILDQTAPSSAGGQLPGPGVVGNLALKGTTPIHEDVAALMRATKKVPGLVSPYFTNSTEGMLSGSLQMGVTFDASSSIIEWPTILGPYATGAIDATSAPTKAVTGTATSKTAPAAGNQ